jgi:hypothetical protein
MSDFLLRLVQRSAGLPAAATPQPASVPSAGPLFWKPQLDEHPDRWPVPEPEALAPPPEPQVALATPDLGSRLGSRALEAIPGAPVERVSTPDPPAAQLVRPAANEARVKIADQTRPANQIQETGKPWAGSAQQGATGEPSLGEAMPARVASFLLERLDRPAPPVGAPPPDAPPDPVDERAAPPVRGPSRTSHTERSDDSREIGSHPVRATPATSGGHVEPPVEPPVEPLKEVTHERLVPATPTRMASETQQVWGSSMRKLRLGASGQQGEVRRIEVRIGRVEVRATPPVPPAPPTGPRRPAPRRGFEEQSLARRYMDRTWY